MSKVKIEGNASGTGTLTISAPNTDTDRSITLPDGAGEVLVTDGTITIDDTNDRVGIGTSSPSQPLSVYGTDGSNNTALFTRSGGTTMYAYIDTGSNAGFFTGSNASGSGFYANSSDNSVRFMTNSTERMRLESDGDLHVDGDVIAYSTTISDERLKENIQPIDDALAKVKQLKGCTFTYTVDGKESAGLIAQDVEQVLPSAVSEKELPLKQDDGIAYKTLQYDQTIGLLVEAIKELSAKVEELENR